MPYELEMFINLLSKHCKINQSSFTSNEIHTIWNAVQESKKLNGNILESRKSLFDLFAPRLDKIFEDQYPTKAQIYDALHKSISDLERT